MLPIAVIGAIAQMAPIVTKWLDAGKTVQEVADKASDIAKLVTGHSTTEDAIDGLKADPVLLAAYQTKLLEQDMEYERLYVADKDSARKRDIVLSATPGGNVRANYLTAAAVVAIFVLLAVAISFEAVTGQELSEFAKAIINTVIILFTSQLGNIYAFEFGTTRRSREKTDVLDNLKL